MVLDQKLLRAADKAAKRIGKNRSALMREALRLYLRELEIQDLERREREAYQRYPDSEDDLQGWGKVSVWPGD